MLLLQLEMSQGILILFSQSYDVRSVIPCFLIVQDQIFVYEGYLLVNLLLSPLYFYIIEDSLIRIDDDDVGKCDPSSMNMLPYAQ